MKVKIIRVSLSTGKNNLSDLREETRSSQLGKLDV
jgi:hypothetical protein